MNRLTEKRALQNYQYIREKCRGYIFSNEELIYQKLGKLEDLEEEIGCPLEVVKHLINGLDFWYEYENGMHCIMCYEISNNTINFGSVELPLNEYGKTYWLKRDKSE